MAKVENNSSVNISRTEYSSGSAKSYSLGNKLFNGYVYNFSLEVGLDGSPSTLTLSLALDESTRRTPTSISVSESRRQIIGRKEGLVASLGAVGNSGNVDARQNIGTYEIPQVDADFDIQQQYLGVNSSYNISIISGNGTIDYQLKNFRISSYAINKNNDQKILTLVLKDISFVLSKVYVGVLGQDMALDSRSVTQAIIDQIKINCPSVGASPGGQVTTTALKQNLHFASENLATELQKIYTRSSGMEVITDGVTGTGKKNYIIIKSTNPNKQIINGYGAVIILGEEDFKDGPCDSAEMLYTFDTLLAAMEKIGISSIPPEYLTRPNPTLFRTLKDKSYGRVKRSYRGNLKDVLGQWCDEFAYSYTISFTSESVNAAATLADTKVLLSGRDLAAPTSKEMVIDAKTQIENLEKSSSESFVVRQQDFSYDLSQTNLRLYSSYYYKEAKDTNLNYENLLGDKNFGSMRLDYWFPSLFGSATTKDFCGANRSYEQVVISAILGRYAPKLRQIYNCRIGAYQALGFMPINNTVAGSKIAASDSSELIFQEAALKALDLQQDLYYSNTSSTNIRFNMYFGFYNPNLASLVETIENLIVDFIGAHYLSAPVTANEGQIANENFSATYEIDTVPATQKIFNDQVYKLDALKQFGYALSEIQSLFAGDQGYFNAFRTLSEQITANETDCKQASAAYVARVTDANVSKNFRFYYKRNAAYGVLQDLINDIQNFTYSFGQNESYTIDLAEIYAPTFKQLTPVSIGALQSALPINISATPPGSYKFGVLLEHKDNIFSFSDLSAANYTNVIEYQNYIRQRCNIVGQINAAGNENTKNATRKTCGKTILYLTCVQPREVANQGNNFSAQLNALADGDPLRCQRLGITRAVPPQDIIQANVNKVLGTASGFITIDPTPLSLIYVKDIRGGAGTPYNLITVKSEYITLPSQNAIDISLRSKTSQSITMPFENYIKGGLESSSDVKKILDNDGFGVELFVNNITPNVRELFGDQTQPSYSTDSSYIRGAIDDGTPFLMNYVGYTTGDAGQFLPGYQFQTFQQFHNALANYYNSRSLSYNQPAVSYSAEIFCNSISSDLRKLLSVFKGMTSLNISLGEAGMTIQVGYKSYPAKIRSTESLINRVRPNIKLVNTNFLK